MKKNDEENLETLMFLPLFVEIIAKNTKIEKEIDELYEKYKIEAYKLAKSSSLMESPLIRGYDIHRDYKSLKVLGLLLLDAKYDNPLCEFSKQLDDLIIKGWKSLYLYVVNKKKVEFCSLSKVFLSSKEEHELTNDYIEYILTGSLLIANRFKIEIDYEDEFLQDYGEEMFLKATVFKRASAFDYNRMSDDDKERGIKIKKRILDNIECEISLDNLFDKNKVFDNNIKKYKKGLGFIFDAEKFRFVNVTKNIEITDKEINEITAIYGIVFKNQNAVDATRFMFIALIVKSILKAYNEVKEYFFKNNRETLFITIEEKDLEIESLKSQNTLTNNEMNIFKKRVEELEGKYKNTLERENQRLEKKNKQLTSKLEKKESLLNQEKEKVKFYESLLQNIASSEDDTEDISLEGIKGLIVGGDDAWRNKMKEVLPDSFKFLSGEKSFDKEFVRDIDYVFIQLYGTSHKTIFRIKSFLSEDVQISCITTSNVEKAINEICSNVRKNN